MVKHCVMKGKIKLYTDYYILKQIVNNRREVKSSDKGGPTCSRFSRYWNWVTQKMTDRCATDIYTSVAHSCS
jgi:hypothetical protein